jgi:hypothetical protein
MDDFFDNILVYFPILAIILIRLIGNAAGRNKARKRPPPVLETEPAEPDWPVDEPEKPAPPVPAFMEGAPSRPEHTAPPPVLPPAKPARPAAPKGGFPETIAALPALQQAVVWAELLGPPKSLQDR